MSRLKPIHAPDNIFSLQSGNAHEIVWFIDYSDHASRRLRDLLLRSIDRFSGLDFTFSVRFFPNGKYSSEGELAARAAIAAGWQGCFAEMHDALLECNPAYGREGLMVLAKNLALDLKRFEDDLDSDATFARLRLDMQSAQDSARVPHTPMIFIDGVMFEGAWDDEAILEAIQKPLGVKIQLASAAFVHWAAASGLVLVAATLLAMAIVNFGFQARYHALVDASVAISFSDWSLKLPLGLWVNDGLMALFFLLVGIEIKRELVDGELSSMEKAALPLVAALGGMLVPAALYVAVNWGEASIHGWGVPMATDIAFTLGILAMLGDRVPTSLKVFVSALAIADDLGAIMVIAIFYGHGFDLEAFLIATMVLAVMLALNAGRVYAVWPYMILGVMLWYFVHESGLHATLAGVLTAATIPSRRSARIEGVAAQASKVFQYEIGRQSAPPSTIGVLHLQKIIDRLREPGFHLQHRLENWSSFLILPMFAFLNTGILIFGTRFEIFDPAVLGTILALVVGKPLGICLFVFVAMRMGIGKLSGEIERHHLLGSGFLCGIGFTMSIFIATAAFKGEELESVKLAVLLASVLSAVIGTAILYHNKPEASPRP